MKKTSNSVCVRARARAVSKERDEKGFRVDRGRETKRETNKPDGESGGGKQAGGVEKSACLVKSGGMTELSLFQINISAILNIYELVSNYESAKSIRRYYTYYARH